MSEAAQSENDALRAELDAENAKLREQIAESRAAQAGSEGLTDADVRRLEHPEEFAGETDEARADEVAAADDDTYRSTAPVAPASTTGHPQAAAGIPAAAEPAPDAGATVREPTLLERALGRGGS